MHSSSDMTEPQKRENPTYITRSDRRQWMLSCLGCVLLFVTLWTVAHQAPLSMKFSRQEHWSGLPCPPPGDLPNSGTEPLFLPSLGFPGDTRGKEPTCQCRRHKRHGFNPGLGRSLGGGHSNPLQCSCLENFMDGGAWWATVHGVAESQTRLKQLSTRALLLSLLLL